jgi:hypothetical protein
MQSTKLFVLFAVLLALAPISAFGAGRAFGGAVYAMSNASEGNEIVVFDRDIHGGLTLADSYPTNGLGTGGQSIDPLASQGSLILSRNHRWLFAVNAGSDDISVFRVRRHSLDLVGNFESGGLFPVSLTLYRNLLYVLNAAVTPWWSPGESRPARISSWYSPWMKRACPVPRQPSRHRWAWFPSVSSLTGSDI